MENFKSRRIMEKDIPFQFTHQEFWFLDTKMTQYKYHPTKKNLRHEGIKSIGVKIVEKEKRKRKAYPQLVARMSPGRIIEAIPKSAIFTLRFLSRRRFSSFKSR